jgi:hypothetical protein
MFAKSLAVLAVILGGVSQLGAQEYLTRSLP